jgi:hypothetical protein
VGNALRDQACVAEGAESEVEDGGRVCGIAPLLDRGLQTSHTLYFAAGLDQHFREYVLASQLAHHIRWTYFPVENVQGVKASPGAVSLLGLTSYLLK